MDYQEKLRLAKEALDSGSYDKETIEYIFPELKESEDERIRKDLVGYFEVCDNMTFAHHRVSDIITWLEKQGKKFIPEDINEAALQYVDTCTVDGEITHDNITEPYWNNHSMMNAYKAGWLEKQDKQKPIPTLTWKHWKDGIGGNGEGKQAFLIKQNGYYSVSSCLSFECDYIELSELDKLLKGEKQSEQKVPMIQWKGDNLKDVIEFTGKSPRFQEWFKTWDEYESYVHEHNNIFKLFDNDGNHWEVPIGAWIVKTPDGFNVPSRAIFKHKS